MVEYLSSIHSDYINIFRYVPCASPTLAYFVPCKEKKAQ